MMNKLAIGLLLVGFAACNSSSTSKKTPGDMAMTNNDMTVGDLAGADLLPPQDDIGTDDAGQFVDLLGIDLLPQPSVTPTPMPSPAAGCGNGTLDPGEQCDDSNNTNLDGCDADCNFEQVQRLTSLTIETKADKTVCTADALGVALKGSAGILGTLLIGPGIKSGSISILTLFEGLSDLTGQGTAQSIDVGVFTGAPKPSPAAYNGTKDLDYWYVPKPTSINSSRQPLGQLPATVGAGNVSVGPGNFSVPIGVATVSLSNATLKATLGTATAPTKTTGNGTGITPPGHEASEHDAASLSTFPSMTGTICGAVTAADLAAAQLGDAATELDALGCASMYTATNSVLDLIVGGCGTLVTPTQPDGPPFRKNEGQYSFTVDGTTHAVDSCTDNMATMTYGTGTTGFQDCLNNATYSLYLGFTADRVIPRNN